MNSVPTDGKGENLQISKSSNAQILKFPNSKIVPLQT
jgi:hypothetical protein